MTSLASFNQLRSSSPSFVEFVRCIVFNELSDDDRRYTQDSPVLADVWLAYAALADNKAEDVSAAGLQPDTLMPPADGDNERRLDLLLAPHRDSSAAELARALRHQLAREIHHRRKATDADEATSPDEVDHRLSFNEGQVAVRLSFGEMIRAAMPLTKWWQRYVIQYDKSKWEKWDRPGKNETSRWALFHESLRSAMSNAEGREDIIQRIDQRRGLEAEAPPGWKVRPDFVWMMSIVGIIEQQRQRKSKKDWRRSTSSGTVIKHAWNVLSSGPDPDPELTSPHLWSISLNRRVTRAIQKSTVAVKADAARLLFASNCSRLTWAVIDAGIDATHAAFRVPGKTREPAFLRRSNGRIRNNTRILQTYDFSRYREIMKIPITDDAPFDPNLSTRQVQEIKKIREGLKSGRSLDWLSVLPLIEVSYLQDDGTPDPAAKPNSRHGTHVAGIIAADWEKDDGSGEHVRGMCPDITLMDMRVLDRDGIGGEYEMLAALQLIRSLNASKDKPFVHGVNISMSLLHDVANYACGRTPVCDEVNRLVDSGVVVVAAAGNQGEAMFTNTKGRKSRGFRTVSITDPGNADKAITVGATHRYAPHMYGVSYFSSRGPTGDGRLKPDLLAPGEKVVSTIPDQGEEAMDGTSMAAPHVSGAAALLLARHSELIGEPARVKQILMETATDLGREPYFQGRGMIDVLRAIGSV